MTSNANTPERHMEVQEQEVDQILKAMWQTAARRNPMVLAHMNDPSMAIEHLRRMIRDCLAKGLSPTDTCDHAVKELVNSAVRNTQPHDTCNDRAAEKHTAS
jgi:hypothetical protein